MDVDAVVEHIAKKTKLLFESRLPKVCEFRERPREKKSRNLHHFEKSTFTEDSFKGQYIGAHLERYYTDLLVLPDLGSLDVMEIGGYPFIFSSALKSLSKSFLCLDPAPDRDSFEGAKPFDLSKPDPFEKIDFKPDLIILHETIEHLLGDLNSIFKSLFSFMKKECQLSITTPNIHSKEAISRLLNSGLMQPGIFTEYEKISKYGHMGHVREYSLFELCYFLKRIGFRKIIIQSRQNTGDQLIDTYLPFNSHIFAIK